MFSIAAAPAVRTLSPEGEGNRLRCGVAAQNIYDTARSLVSAAGQQAMISSLVTT